MSTLNSERTLLALNDLNKSQSKLPQVGLFFSLYIILGIGYFTGSQNFTVLNSLYFTVITYTTVGYGDILPPNQDARLFTCFFILLGVAMTGYLYALISDIVVDNNNRMRKKHNNRVVKIVSKMAKIRSKSMAAIKGKLFSGKEKKRSDPAGDSTLLSEGVQSNSSTSGSIDALRQAYIQSFEYEFSKLRKKATLSVLLILAVLTIGALVMAAIEGWGTIDSIYWACVTITTVGYGDLTPSTAAGKVFTVAYCIVGCVSMTLAWTELIKFPTAMKYKQNELKVMHQFDETMSEGALRDICNSKALTVSSHLKQTPMGEVSKIEFVLGLLHLMGKLNERDIMLATDVFDRLDIDRDGIVRSVPAETDFKRSLESSCSGDDVELGRVCPKDERSNGLIPSEDDGENSYHYQVMHLSSRVASDDDDDDDDE